jgi:hypothetical protein
VLSDVDSVHEDDTDDSLSWDESDHESNEMSHSYSEKGGVDSHEILGRDGYVFILVFYNGVILPQGTVNITFFMVPQQG